LVLTALIWIPRIDLPAGAGKMSYIGVLSLQGDFSKHLAMLQKLGCEARLFSEASEIKNLKGLVIPGGESTTIAMLLDRRGLIEPLRAAIQAGLPVFGTCAGAILLAKTIRDSQQLRLGLLDIEIERNAYGTQIDSFEATLEFLNPFNKERSELEGVFIRAPIICSQADSVQVLAQFNGQATLVLQKNILAATFHPELTQDSRLHRFFCKDLCGLKLA